MGAVAPSGVRSWRGYPLLSSLKASDPGGLICELSPHDKVRAGGPADLEHKRGQGLFPKACSSHLRFHSPVVQSIIFPFSHFIQNHLPVPS